MKSQEDLLRHKVVRAVRDYVGKVKEEVVQEQRTEQDYPVKINQAVEHLVAHLREIPVGSINIPVKRKVLEGILRSGAWNPEELGRKRYKTGSNYSYKFFLPNDQHFGEQPKTQIAYVRLLFRLERKLRASLGPPEERIGSIPEGIPKSCETEVRSSYRRLIGRSRGAAFVRIPELRREVSVRKEVFDREILRMRDRGEVILSKHDHAASLPAQELQDCIEIGPGEHYYYLRLRENL